MSKEDQKYNIFKREPEKFALPETYLAAIEEHLEKIANAIPEGKTIPIGLIPIQYGPLIEIQLVNGVGEDDQNLPASTRALISRSDVPIKRLLIFNKGPAKIFFFTNHMSSSLEAGIEVEPNDSSQVEGDNINRLFLRTEVGDATVKIIGVI